MPKALAPAVILLLVAGIAGWLWFRTIDEAPQPLPDEAISNEETAEGVPAEIERAPVELPPPSPTAGGGTDPEPKPTEQGPAANAPDAPPNVELIVRSSRTQGPVTAFRWVFNHHGAPVRAEGQDGRAALVLPAQRPGELLVEADGHVPFTLALTTPAADAPMRRIDVFLDEAATATGIEITAVSVTNAPIPSVRVDAYRLPEQAGLGAWNRGKALWSRRTAATDGRYVLPELPPGDYGIRLLATDTAGQLLPLLPFSRTFALTGSNGFVERAVLEPGCLPGFELVDLAGRPLDPAAQPIRLSLRLAGGPEVSRRWIHQSETGRFAAQDAPPRPGTCWLDEAVAPGLYQLTVTMNGDVRYDQQLALRAGERQQERIVLR